MLRFQAPILVAGLALHLQGCVDVFTGEQRQRTGISDERRIHVHACDIISPRDASIDALSTYCRRAPSFGMMASWWLALGEFVDVVRSWRVLSAG